MKARKFKSEQQRSGRILTLDSSRTIPIPSPEKQNKYRNAKRHIKPVGEVGPRGGIIHLESYCSSEERNSNYDP